MNTLSPWRVFKLLDRSVSVYEKRNTIQNKMRFQVLLLKEAFRISVVQLTAQAGHGSKASIFKYFLGRDKQKKFDCKYSL